MQKWPNTDGNAEFREDIFPNSQIPSPDQGCENGSNCGRHIPLGVVTKSVISISLELGSVWGGRPACQCEECELYWKPSESVMLLPEGEM